MAHARPPTLLPWVLLFLPACAAEESGGDAAIERPWLAPLAERQDDPFPRRYTNRAGERVAVATRPRRIASATLCTDAVLLEICDRERLVALHEISTKPSFSPIVEESQAFGRHVNSDPESILAVRPDLVFLSSFSDKRSKSLIASAGLSVVRLDEFDSVQEIVRSIRAVGYLIGRDADAEGLVRSFEARLEAVRAAAAKRADWRLLSWSGGNVPGAGTTFDSMCACIGAQNEASRAGLKGHRQPAAERLLGLQPHALVLPVGTQGEAKVREALAAHPAMKGMEAVRRGRLIFVSNALMLSTSHHIARAVQQIARQLDTWGRP